MPGEVKESDPKKGAGKLGLGGWRRGHFEVVVGNFGQPWRKVVLVLAHPRQPRYADERWQHWRHTLVNGDMRMHCSKERRIPRPRDQDWADAAGA